MHKHLSLLILVSFALGCASTPTEPSVKTRNVDWIKEKLAREAQLPDLQVFTSDDGRFSTLASANLIGPVESNEMGNYVIGLDIGTGAPMHCVVYPDAMDPAATLQQISGIAFNGMRQHYGSLGTWIEDVDADAVGDHAALAASWMYRSDQSDRSVIGQFKQKIATSNRSTVYCHHDQLGYGKSFERVFAQIVENLSFAQAAAGDHYYEEIVVFNLKGRRVGVMQMYLTLDADGDTRTERSTSFLVPSDASNFLVRDAYSIEYTTPSGELINQLYVESEAGVLATQLELLPRGEDGWRVRGTFKGQDLDTDFTVDGPISSGMSERLAARRAFDRDAESREHQIHIWHPDSNPSGTTAAEIRFGEPSANGTMKAELRTEFMEGEVVFDPTGSGISGITRMGPAEIHWERVYQRGTL